MAFVIVPYQLLVSKIYLAVRELISHHNRHSVKSASLDGLIKAYESGAPNPGFLAQEYAHIPKERRTQVAFLLTVINLLAKSLADEGSKQRVLNAAALYIYIVIQESYPKSGPLSYFTSPDNSNLFTNLGYALQIDDKLPDEKTLHHLFTALLGFLKKHVYANPEQVAGDYLPPEQLPFSRRFVENFQVESYLKNLNTRLSELENTLIDRSRAAARLTPGAANIGLFSSSSESSSSSRTPSPPATSAETSSVSSSGTSSGSDTEDDSCHGVSQSL